MGGSQTSVQAEESRKKRRTHDFVWLEGDSFPVTPACFRVTRLTTVDALCNPGLQITVRIIIKGCCFNGDV